MKTRKTVAAKGSAGDSGSVAGLLLSHAFFLVTLIMRQALMKKRTLKRSSIRLLALFSKGGNSQAYGVICRSIGFFPMTQSREGVIEDELKTSDAFNR
jgi:hypothetical protein